MKRSNAGEDPERGLAATPSTTAVAEHPASPPAASTHAPASEPAKATRKHFVIDTNILLHNPNALFMFHDNEVVVPFAVLEELDKLKRGTDDIARNAREAIRHLDALRQRGRLVDGVRWNGHGGEIRVALDQAELCPHLRDDTPDNRIISIAWRMAQQGRRTVFISKDINARIRADAIGLVAEDFESEKVDADRLYTGYATVDADPSLIDELYTERQIVLDRLEPFLSYTAEDGSSQAIDILPNQFVLLRDLQDPSHTGLARRLADTNHIIPVTGPRRPVFGLMARNLQQTMALDLLLDDDVRLVSLLGTAGTGKTLLALAAGMSKVFNEQRYDKLLVARPIMPLGRDIGYLPGDKDEKLTAWMQPIFDNLAFLLSTRGTHMNHADSQSTEQRMEKLVSEGKLVLEPLTYIRGRSIPHQFMIVDEAQNLTPHEVKTITSRVGDGTKIVLTGDIMQIDNPYLDEASNGLSYLVERLKYEGIVGHVTLAKSERSDLARLVTELL